jgi:hypothetical protein
MRMQTVFGKAIRKTGFIGPIEKIPAKVEMLSKLVYKSLFVLKGVGT